MKLQDKLELISFPSTFHIKAIGLNNEAFEKEVLHIIHSYCPDLTENSLQIRPSKECKYLSITVKILAKSKEQLDNIYQELSQSKDVMMVL